jgi:hypothetical protein
VVKSGADLTPKNKTRFPMESGDGSDIGGRFRARGMFRFPL